MKWLRRYRRMRWALVTIGTTCTNYTSTQRCSDPSSHRTPESPYGSERWCDGCIARAGLNG